MADPLAGGVAHRAQEVARERLVVGVSYALTEGALGELHGELDRLAAELGAGAGRLVADVALGLLGDAGGLAAGALDELLLVALRLGLALLLHRADLGLDALEAGEEL